MNDNSTIYSRSGASSQSSSNRINTPTNDGPSTGPPNDAVDTVIATNPLIFSCISCRTIVGDSYSFITSNETHKTLTLSAASNIVRSAVVQTSKSGYDIGSTYFTFQCANCPQTLGRYYITTSEDLDVIRTKFTFTCDNLSTYEVGKATFGKVLDREVVEFAVDGETGPKNSGLGIWTTASYEAINSDILKMKHLIADHSERLAQLEQALLYSKQQTVVQQSTVAQVTNMSLIGNPNIRYSNTMEDRQHEYNANKRYRIDG